MSSVGSSDRASKTDELRRTREEYQNQDAEKTKKAKKELVKTQEYFQEEIDKLKEKYETKIADLRNKNSEMMSERDVENQSKINKMRSAYNESLKNRTDESAAKSARGEDTSKELVAKERAQNDQRIERLKSNFEDNLKGKTADFSESLTKARDEMRKAIESRSDKLNEKHKNELAIVREDRDQSVSNKSQLVQDTRQTLSRALSEEKRNRALEKERLQAVWMGNLEDKDATSNSNISSMSEALQSERQRQQKKFSNALENKLAELDGAHQVLKDQVASRLNRDVIAITSELTKTKTDKTNQQNQMRRLTDIEKDNIVDAYEDRMAAYEKERTQMRDAQQDQVDGKVGVLLDRTEKLIQNTNRDFKVRQNVTNTATKEDRANIIGSYEGKLGHLENRTEERVMNMVQATNEVQRKQAKIHERTLDQMKRDYLDKLASQREAHIETLSETQVRMGKKIQEIETKHQRKLDETINNYEKKLATLQEQFSETVEKRESTLESKMANQNKAGELDKKSLNQKFEIRVSQLENQHQKELERLQRKHDEQMNQLASRVNAFRKT